MRRSPRRSTTCTLLRELSGLGGQAGKKPVIVFHGSEPLLVKDVLKRIVVDRADESSSAYRPTVTTWTTRPRLLHDHRVSLGISLDSPYKEVNDQIRPLGGGGRNLRPGGPCHRALDGYRIHERDSAP
jgi:uncharacterized protein